MRFRRALPVALAMALVLGQAAPVSAHIPYVNADPNTQTKNSGQTVSWTVNWSSTNSPYVVKMTYGDGTSTTKSVSGTSTTFSHTYYVCVATNFYPKAQVWDEDDHTDTDTVHVHINAGSTC